MNMLAAIQSTSTSAATPPPSALPSWSAVLKPQINATATMITAITVMTTQPNFTPPLSVFGGSFPSSSDGAPAVSGEGDDRRDTDRERDGARERLRDGAFLLDRADGRLGAEAAAEDHVLPERDRLVGHVQPPPAAKLGGEQQGEPEKGGTKTKHDPE